MDGNWIQIDISGDGDQVHTFTQTDYCVGFHGTARCRRVWMSRAGQTVHVALGPGPGAPAGLTPQYIGLVTAGRQFRSHGGAGGIHETALVDWAQSFGRS